MFKLALRALPARRPLIILPTRCLCASACQRADPWLLPNTPAHEAATQSEADLAPLPPLPRPNEAPATTRARLLYQSRKRGTLETDLLLSTFAQEHLPGMTQGELHEYDKLLDEPDWDIYYWSTEKRQPPERWAHSTLLSKLREHTRNEGKVMRRMPDLSASSASAT